MTNCCPSENPAAALQRGGLNCMSEAVLLSETRSSQQKPWGKVTQLLLSRRFTCCSRRLKGDALCQCRFHPSPRAACLCALCLSARASRPPTPGAVLLSVGRSKRVMMLGWSIFSVHRGTELPWTALVCPTPGLRWVCVFQMCLKVNLHSSAFSGSSFLYFLGTSTCCQLHLFAVFGGANALLLRPLRCFGQARVEVISPPAMLAVGGGRLGVYEGAASPSRSPSCWAGCRPGGVCIVGCLQLCFDCVLESLKRDFLKLVT